MTRARLRGEYEYLGRVGYLTKVFATVSPPSQYSLCETTISVFGAELGNSKEFPKRCTSNQLHASLRATLQVHDVP